MPPPTAHTSVSRCTRRVGCRWMCLFPANYHIDHIICCTQFQSSFCASKSKIVKESVGAGSYSRLQETCDLRKTSRGLTFEKYLEVMFSAIGCTLFFYNFGAGCDMHKAFDSFERASVISALVILPVEYSHSTLAFLFYCIYLARHGWAWHRNAILQGFRHDLASTPTPAAAASTSFASVAHDAV